MGTSLTVVDTNVIANLVLNGSLKGQAVRLLKNEPLWGVPLLWKSEFRNVLALYIRKGLLSLNDAIRLMDYVENEMKLVEYSINSLKVLELVNKSKLSSYDCEFVSLALQLNTKLVTDDKLILKEFPKTATPLRQI